MNFFKILSEFCVTHFGLAIRNLNKGVKPSIIKPPITIELFGILEDFYISWTSIKFSIEWIMALREVEQNFVKCLKNQVKYVKKQHISSHQCDEHIAKLEEFKILNDFQVRVDFQSATRIPKKQIMPLEMNPQLSIE